MSDIVYSVQLRCTGRYWESCPIFDVISPISSTSTMSFHSFNMTIKDGNTQVVCLHHMVKVFATSILYTRHCSRHAQLTGDHNCGKRGKFSQKKKFVLGIAYISYWWRAPLGPHTTQLNENRNIKVTLYMASTNRRSVFPHSSICIAAIFSATCRL